MMIFAASTAFLLFEAKSMIEYGRSYFLSMTALVHIVCLIAIIPKSSNIFILMEKFEKFVEKSE